MRHLDSLAKRLADQAEAKKRLLEKISKTGKRSGVATKSTATSQSIASESVTQTSETLRPWANVRAGNAALKFSARATGDRISVQPWTNGLVSELLRAADHGDLSLCFVWPARMASLALIHALANFERVYSKDLRGLRTLLYPGTHASHAAFHSVLVDRQQLSDFYRSLWKQQPSGSTDVVTHTSSPALLAALAALNDIRINQSDLPNPSIAELIPAFVYRPESNEWAATVESPIERTLSKVDRRSYRRELRRKVGEEWKSPDRAPGALMVLHHTAKKGAWRAALSAAALRSQGRPEVLLLDATDSAMRTSFSSVKQITTLLTFARDNGFHDTGAVIVTDDPKTFFILRAQLREAKLLFSTKVWAAEAEEVLLSRHPVGATWQPSQRSDSSFSVSIVDRDASQVALTFQRLAVSACTDESDARAALLRACVYVLRLSNMPAGYMDLTAASDEAGEGDYGSQQNAWTPVKVSLLEALASGVLNEVREAVERVIGRAEKLIDDWNDATPMALRMLAEVRKHAIDSRHGICLALPSKRYVQLAHRFLQRKLKDDWLVVEPRIEWHTLSSAGKTLTGEWKDRHVTVVGLSPDVIRILVTHLDMPNGTTVLVAYRQAESILTTLTGMKSKDLEAFCAYRGRIGALTQELELRLAEVPNPVGIAKLREIPLTFTFDDNVHAGQVGDQGYYKFELEGGSRAYGSGWVYRHVPDEDPPFRRAAASAIHPGDFIFDMSDELRATLEASLELKSNGGSSVANPERILLKLYHDDVHRRCASMFHSKKRSALAREIHARMVELDPKAVDCRPGRVYYWLALPANEDSRPHASKDANYFRIFCKALGVSDEAAEQYWAFVRNARRLNQHLGRELVARYAEILFHPESALTYRKVTESVIRQLQQEALGCVYRVERVVPPPARSALSNE